MANGSTKKVYAGDRTRDLAVPRSTATPTWLPLQEYLDLSLMPEVLKTTTIVKNKPYECVISIHVKCVLCDATVASLLPSDYGSNTTLNISPRHGVYGFIDGGYPCPEPTLTMDNGTSVVNPAFNNGSNLTLLFCHEYKPQFSRDSSEVNVHNTCDLKNKANNLITVLDRPRSQHEVPWILQIKFKKRQALHMRSRVLRSVQTADTFEGLKKFFVIPSQVFLYHDTTVASKDFNNPS
ncbi:hypothetical protein RND71_016151 [Anisodus tanguticus]|uniref:Uncharacterized protein n=1 Tax=Anisodus tanguticus TaxID=243964 RepID=A0AAE1VCF7_9SOLA|nr:hypothetical protein RND71_016151 [Anisodus tanguticus]